jgi:hypothetical protein
MIAALFVEAGGAYCGLDGVDPWDVSRDARKYGGPWPVIAHPPCKRWGRYWSGGPNAKIRRSMGDDGGCFASALSSVRKYGGILEHPEASHAWRVFALRRPPRNGGWVAADRIGGLTCCVEQGHYGHKARKATWLYVFAVHPIELVWGESSGQRMDAGYNSAAAAKADRARADYKPLKRLTSSDRLATPTAFRDALISMVSRPYQAQLFDVAAGGEA